MTTNMGASNTATQQGLGRGCGAIALVMGLIVLVSSCLFALTSGFYVRYLRFRDWFEPESVPITDGLLEQIGIILILLASFGGIVGLLGLIIARNHRGQALAGVGASTLSCMILLVIGLVTSNFMNMPAIDGQASVHGQIELNGEPVPFEVVTLANPETEGDLARSLETRTDAEGNYQFASVEPGMYYLIVSITVPETMRCSTSSPGFSVVQFSLGVVQEAMDGAMASSADHPMQLQAHDDTLIDLALECK